jgi:hypothetical protein
MSTNNNNKIINNNNNSNNKINKNKKRNFLLDIDVTNNPLLMGLIFIIALFFIIFVLYNYSYTANNVKNSSTFYGKDILNFEPIFDIETEKLEDCIDRCDNDIYCAGITYNTSNKKCIGTKEGFLRKDDNNFIAYIKPKNLQKFDKDNILSGYISDYKVIPDNQIQKPRFVGEFSNLFWININNWYDGFENWKHVIHKGTDIESSINFKNWDDIEKNIPEQSPGVWLAPYTNNIRICFTTENKDYKENKYNHSHVQICIDDNNINTKNTELKPKFCYTSDNEEKINTEKNLEDYEKSEGTCRDKLDKYPNFTEYNDTYATCKAKCSEDKLCQGFSMNKFKNECKLFSKYGKRKGNDLNTLITGGSRGVFDGDKYTCYKKINYVDETLKKNKIEYVDIKNIDINKLFHLSIISKYNYIEIYVNGKLVKIKNLKGNIISNNGNLHIKKNLSFNGIIYNYNYIPNYVKKDKVESNFNIKPTIKKK